MASMLWAAREAEKKGAPVWAKEASSLWTEKISKMKMIEVGEVILHWQWKRNKGKQTEAESHKGRIIFAIDTARTFGRVMLAQVEAMLAGLGGERKIGPAPRGPLERDASKLLAELKEAA
eukprot:8978-Pyramimonas_sp.AAC.1